MDKKKQNRRKLMRILLICEIVVVAVLCITLILVLLKGPQDEHGIIRRETETESESETDNEKNYHVKKEKYIENPTEKEVESYWENSLFFGDSIMKGFGNYLSLQEEGTLGDPLVDAMVNYSLVDALKGENEVEHPLYHDEMHTIFYAAEKEQPEKIVLFFGINDLGMCNVSQILTNYDTTIQKLEKICPDAEIYVASTTPVYKGREGGNRTNANIQTLNSKMEEYCEENGYGFLDLYTEMSDEDGSLYSGYTADFYVHLNSKAYVSWLQLFRQYAYEALSGKTAPEDLYPITRPDPVATPSYTIEYDPEKESVLNSQPEEESSVTPSASQTETSGTSQTQPSQQESTAPTQASQASTESTASTQTSQTNTESTAPTQASTSSQPSETQPVQPSESPADNPANSGEDVENAG